MIGPRLQFSFIHRIKFMRKCLKIVFLGLVITQLSACNPLPLDNDTDNEDKIKTEVSTFIDALNLNKEQNALLYFYAQITENMVALDTADSLKSDKSGSDMLLFAECSIDYFADLSDVLRYTDNIRTKILNTDAKRALYTRIENSDEVAMASPSTDISCDDLILTYSRLTYSR